MIKAKAYAAQTAKSPLTPYSFERRDPGPLDVQIDIQYCGICHSDIHMARNEWGMSTYPCVPGHADRRAGGYSSQQPNERSSRKGDLAGVGFAWSTHAAKCSSCRGGSSSNFASRA